MIDDREALRKIRRWADLHSRGVICEAEIANSVLSTTLEASLNVCDECLAALPDRRGPHFGRCWSSSPRHDYFDDRHRYASDGRTNEEREAYFRRMQPHYRKIGEHILSRLPGDRTGA